jgi:hypothetical protein
MPRRSIYDPLATRDRPQWLVTTKIYREPLHVAQLPPGANMRAAMATRLAQLVAEGWQAEGDGMAYGFAFLSRSGEPIQVSATAIDPIEAYGPGHSYLVGPGVAAVGKQI